MSENMKYLGNGVINIHIPFAVKRRGGRKLILSPNGDNAVFEAKPHQDNSLIKVLVRAYKWRRHFETSKYKSLDELAEKRNSPGIPNNHLKKIIMPISSLNG
jgi:hypothetical protein